MIRKLYNLGYFDYEKFILNNLKPLSLFPSEALVLIKLLDYFKESDLFNYEKLKNSLFMKKDEFEGALANLLEKGYYAPYLKDINGALSEAINLDGFFDKANSILNSEIIETETDINSIIRMVTEGLNKILTGTDLEIIKSLVDDDRYTYFEFKEALSNLENKSIKNIKTLTNELSKTRKRNQTKPKEEAPDFFKEFLNNVK